MSNLTFQDFVGNDIIDIRDVIARVEELREEKHDLIDAVTEAYHAREIDPSDDNVETHQDAMKEEGEWREENSEELETLEALLSSLCGYGGDEQWEGDWYPVTLIKESHFEESMDDLLEGGGFVPKDLPFFLKITVDYDALKQDYSEVEFEGFSYYYR